ncbi:hypothetical protein [Curtobacterium oceanosedimentum]|uniref:hypothetical protein n=1 Tax=Curtobacterium oceanosedimentum TaxID=465820 RepID=UPI003398AE29
MYSSGPGPFFYIVALLLIVLNVWTMIIVLRAGYRYLDRTAPPRKPRPPREPLFPKPDNPQE